MNKLKYILYITLLAVLSACSDKLDFFSDEDGIEVGDEVQFVARVPQVATRTVASDAYWEHINKFERVQDDYVFDVEMREKGAGDAVKIATASYNPTKNTVDKVTTYDDYGTLTEASDVMLWPSNVKKYGFHAVSSNSSENVETDQTTLENYFKQDLIEGYGYVPGWDETLNEGKGAPIRNLDGYNYLTAKEWYAANKSWGAPDGMSSAQLIEHWKKIPLFMRHKRSRITVLLKAGEGVEREQIKYDKELNPQNIITEIYSYDSGNNQTVVKPLLGSYHCHYDQTNLLPEENITTACYDAIVNPHNYADGSNLTDQKILSVNLSGMKFSFYAANDKAYSSAVDAENSDVKTRYNLTEGKHLILEVTLSTDTRKILITAYVVDWEDWPFSSICDDFGQASDPMPINNKKELIDFLTDPEKNKPGNVGVIMPLDFNLLNPVYLSADDAKRENDKHLITDVNGKKPGEKDYITTYEDGYTLLVAGKELAGAGWDPANYELKATIRLAGATITTDQRLFKSIAPSGSLVNGSVVIADRVSDSPIECAIALENYGTLERINVQKGKTERKATRAGLVTTNYGTIYACTSQMPVYNAGGGSEVLIGGIAAEMLYPMKADENGVITPDTSTLPVIDQCNVNARIDGGTNVKGGGIAGCAEGKLSNNTFEYGITLLQKADQFKNILYAKGTQDLKAYDNEWSTKAGNTVQGGTTLDNFRPEADRYDQIIDSQAELHELVSNNAYNIADKHYRIADSFTVDGTWDLGLQNQLYGTATGNLWCDLDCNDKTITLTGTPESPYAKMLFSNIQGHLYDLTLVLAAPIKALPNASADDDAGKLPARAPLAYAVVGAGSRLSNVKVKALDRAYVMSTASGGLVVWAYNGAVIEDCQSNADVRIALPSGTGSQQTYFVGGLVCSAAEATILRCTYQRDRLNESEDTSSSNVYYGGIVGGTNTKVAGSYPKLHISDCASWLMWESTRDYPHAAWGGIIGYSKYQNANSVLVNATDGNCQGNWWAATYGAAAPGMAAGMTEEKVIGKKNSVQPARDNNY